MNYYITRIALMFYSSSELGDPVIAPAGMLVMQATSGDRRYWLADRSGCRPAAATRLGLRPATPLEVLAQGTA